MNLVPYTLTALSRQDIPDTPNDRNVVIGAVITCQTPAGATVTMFDDATGTNGSASKQTGANGQVTVFVEPGEYVFSVNGRANKVVVADFGLRDALAAPDSSVLVGGVEAERLVKSYPSTQSILNLPTYNTNTLYSTNGYWQRTDGGGGDFIFLTGSFTPDNANIFAVAGGFLIRTEQVTKLEQVGVTRLRTGAQNSTRIMEFDAALGFRMMTLQCQRGIYPFVATKIFNIVFEGHNGARQSTQFSLEHLSGDGFQFAGRSSGLRRIAVVSTKARRAASNPITDNWVDVFYGDDDAPTSNPNGSRTVCQDVLVVDSPCIGIYALWNNEFAEWGNVTVHGARKHPYVFDDGTTKGYVNKLERPFEMTLLNLRAFECGGNFLIGRSGQSQTPRMLTFHQPECLDIAYDAAVRVSEYMMVIQAPSTRVIQPDIEDQRYANSVDTLGNARPSLAAPVKGIEVISSQIHLEQPYFSSLVEHVKISSNAHHWKVINPTSFPGTYGIPATNGTVIESSATLGGRFEGLTAQNTGVTSIIRNLNRFTLAKIDGREKIGLISSLALWDVTQIPIQRTVTSGVIRIDGELIEPITADGNSANLVRIRRINSVDLLGGWPDTKTTLVNEKAYNITIQDGGSGGQGRIRTKSGSDVILGSGGVRFINLRYSAVEDTWYEV